MTNSAKTYNAGIERGLCFLMLLFAMCFLAACSRPMEEALIGKWKWDEGKQDFEFFHDNTFLIAIHGINDKITGKWIIVGENRVKGEIVSPGTTSTIMFEDLEISGDELRMTIVGNGPPIPATLTRAR